jgi:glycosyltransferase involved in cell wall biosynthesis
MQKVVIIGPAYPLRGGLASYNERLCRAFNQQGHQSSIFTFSLQYPAFLFPGTTQYSTEAAPADIHIKVCINSINPFNWVKVGLTLKKLQPDVIVVRYWLPFMGPCLGTLLRIAKSNKHTRVVCIADNIIPHEKRPGDKWFTRYFVKAVDAFITMSEKVLADLPLFVTNKAARFVPHPLYDNFGTAVSKAEARQHLSLPQNEKILLFFGFIRKYKGLDMLLQTMALLKQDSRFASASHVKLLVAGEFYEDKKPYDELIGNLGIAEQLILRTDFIPDSEVKNYLCAADVVVQPYRNATQSGVTPLAYHFEKPMIVTNVGGLPALVPHGKAGLVAEPNPAAIATAIVDYFKMGEAHFVPGLQQEKQKYSWSRMTEAIFELAKKNPANQ